MAHSLPVGFTVSSIKFVFYGCTLLHWVGDCQWLVIYDDEWTMILNLSLVLYFLAVIVQIFSLVRYNIDASYAVVNVCLSYSFLEVAGINTLLNPSPCFIALFEWVALLLYTSRIFFCAHCKHSLLQFDEMDKTDNNSVDDYLIPCSERGGIHIYWWVSVLLEILTPLIIIILHTATTNGWSKSISCFKRLDLIPVFCFIRIMQITVLPLSWLKSISDFNVQRLHHCNKIEHHRKELISFEITSKWVDIPDGVSLQSRLYIYLKKLGDRYTVIFSFLKLLVSVAFSIFVDLDYLQCGVNNPEFKSVLADQNNYSYNIEFSEDSGWFTAQWRTRGADGKTYVKAYCVSHQIAVSQNDDYELFASMSSACVCHNWMVFQFTVIILHSVHFIAQCYFYIRFDHFNPQQHQIECVQEYSFVGNNLKLFLTHPSICFLSVCESAALVIVWLQVYFQPGWVESHNPLGSTDWFAIEFAIATTLLEIYKANVSIAWKNIQEKQYGWALWSFFRIDLFVFFGFTVFFQTFIFPISLTSYCHRHYNYIFRKAQNDKKTASCDHNQNEEDELM